MTEPVPITDEAGPPETAYTDLLASFRRVQRERDEAKRVIRNAHQAIRTQTTAAAVALAMFDTGDVGAPSLLDERDALRAELERTRKVVVAAKAWFEVQMRQIVSAEQERQAGLDLENAECTLMDAVDALPVEARDHG